MSPEPTPAPDAARIYHVPAAEMYDEPHPNWPTVPVVRVSDCHGSVLESMDWTKDTETARERDEQEDQRERRESYARDEREADERERREQLGR